MSNQAVMTTIPRAFIERSDFSGVMEILEQLGISDPQQTGAETLTELQSSVGFLVDGYNDDPRELFHIPEVRHFFQQLHAAWPFGLFFFRRTSQTLQLLVMCHIEAKTPQSASVAAGTFAIPTDSVVTFLKASAPPVLYLAERIGWTPEQSIQFLAEIAAMFGVGRGTRPPPETAEAKRQRHHAFLKDQNRTLAAEARTGFQNEGRGAILVGQPDPGTVGCQVMFVAQSSLLETEGLCDDRQLHAQIERYDPEVQYVVCILEPPAADSYIIAIP